MPNAEAPRNNEGPKELDKYIQDIHRKAGTLLSNLAAAPTHHDSVHSQGDLPPAVQTSYLTSTTDLPNNQVAHHMKNLIRKGLAERVQQIKSTDPASQPGPLGENVYQCTERGIEAAEMLDAQPVGGSLDSLRAELERQQEELAWTKRMMMKMAVNTDTLSIEQAEEMMPSDEFQKAFGE